MSIDNITQKILSEANKVAEDTVKNAEAQSADIINDAEKKAESFIKSAEENSKMEAEILKKRKISAAELQARKMLLSAKQDIVKKSFDLALDKLKNMPEEKYINYLSDEIVKIPDCAGVIILNEADKQNIGEKLVKVVNEKLKQNKIELSNNTINAGGGFVLKNGDIEINNTFETLLDSVKEELTFEVANMLFK